MTGAMELIEGIVSVFLNRVPGYRIRDTEYSGLLAQERFDMDGLRLANFQVRGRVVGEPWFARSQQDRP